MKVAFSFESRTFTFSHTGSSKVRALTHKMIDHYLCVRRCKIESCPVAWGCSSVWLEQRFSNAVLSQVQILSPLLPYRLTGIGRTELRLGDNLGSSPSAGACTVSSIGCRQQERDEVVVVIARTKAMDSLSVVVGREHQSSQVITFCGEEDRGSIPLPCT